MENKRYNNARKRRKHEEKRGNFADHVQQLEESPDNHPFARRVLRGYQQIPSAILYTDRQIDDIRRFCCSASVAETTILGVDKTFNLGQLHVTITAFKNLAILRRDTQEHPIFFVPMFVHGSSTTVEYSSFFDHIRRVLGCTLSSPIIGSDDEKALTLAIKKAWPYGWTMNCHRHLHKNCSDYLQRKVDMSDQQKRYVISLIFGQNVVTAADNHGCV